MKKVGLTIPETGNMLKFGIGISCTQHTAPHLPPHAPRLPSALALYRTTEISSTEDPSTMYRVPITSVPSSLESINHPDLRERKKIQKYNSIRYDYQQARY